MFRDGCEFTSTELMYHCSAAKMKRIRNPSKTIVSSRLTRFSTGPVTDYSASVLHWMRDRAPNYRGGYTGERERPSASYIVDVRATRNLTKISIKSKTNTPGDDSTSRTTSVPS